MTDRRDLRQKNSRRILLFAFFLLVFFCFILYFIDPSHIPFDLCLFHRFFGLYCATCGCTRGAYELLHGHPDLFLRQNLLFPFYLILSGWILSAWYYRKNFLLPLFLLTGLMIVFMIVRNLPFECLNILRPL